LFINLKIFSQVNDTTDIIIDAIEEMPVFPGGFNSIWCFLERNFHYDILNAGNKKVKYITRFVIDTLGKATDFKIIASIPQNIIFDHQDSLKISEIFRVLELMQTWQPAKQNNKKVRCLYSIPVMTPYTEFKCKQFQKKGKNNSH
jgi:protein TonB